MTLSFWACRLENGKALHFLSQPLQHGPRETQNVMFINVQECIKHFDLSSKWPNKSNGKFFQIVKYLIPYDILYLINHSNHTRAKNQEVCSN
jgi:hypothetical protein